MRHIILVLDIQLLFINTICSSYRIQDYSKSIIFNFINHLLCDQKRAILMVSYEFISEL